MKIAIPSPGDFIQFFLRYLPRNRGLIGISLVLPLMFGACGGGAIGGIGLDAPVADLEGGTTREAFVCGTADGASPGDVVRLTNISDASVAPVQLTLDDTLSYSAEVCMRVGQSTNVQIFDATGTAISEIRTVSRLPGEDGDQCPDPAVSPSQECP